MKVTDQLKDVTTASGGALDSGVLDVDAYDYLGYSLTAIGANPPTAFAVKLVRNDGTTVTIASPTNPTAGNTVVYSLGPGGSQSTAVPMRIQFTATGGAASTMRFTLWGQKTV